MTESAAQSMLNDLSNYISGLEERIKSLEEGISALMSEEDIKLLPSYKLLELAYGSLLNENHDKPVTSAPSVAPKAKIGAGKSAIEKARANYDPLFTPPSLRHRGSNRKSAIVEPAIKARFPLTDQEVSQGLGGSPHQPDTSVLLLDDGPKAKIPIKAKVTTSTPAPNISTPAPEIISAKGTVYSIDVDGKSALLYEGNLYSVDSVDENGAAHHKIGELTETGFRIGPNSKPITRTEQLTELKGYDQPYYKGAGNKVYKLLNGKLAMSVGQLDDDGNLGLWS